MDQPDIVKYLPDFGDADADLDGCTYLGGNIQSMIKQVDVTTTDGEEYSFFLITSAQKAIRRSSHWPLTLFSWCS